LFSHYLVGPYFVGPKLAGPYLAKAKISIWPIRAEIWPKFAKKEIKDKKVDFINF